MNKLVVWLKNSAVNTKSFSTTIWPKALVSLSYLYGRGKIFLLFVRTKISFTWFKSSVAGFKYAPNKTKTALIAIPTIIVIAWFALSAIIPSAGKKIEAGLANSFSYVEKKLAKKEEQKVPEQHVLVLVRGKLRNAQIANQSIPVVEGQIISLDDQGAKLTKQISVVNDKLSRAVLASDEVSLKEVLCFTVPGDSEKYWLGGKSGPTNFRIEQNGVLEFSLCYPEAFSNFTTSRRNAKGIVIPSPVEIKVDTVTSMPENPNSPRQIVRLSGPAAVVLPDVYAENKVPDQDIKTTLQNFAENNLYEINAKKREAAAKADEENEKFEEEKDAILKKIAKIPS